MTHSEFWQNHNNNSLWDEVIQALLEQESIQYQTISRFPMGGNIVYDINGQLVVKLFAPFDSHEYEIETEVLEKTDWSQIEIQVPQLVTKGIFEGWHFFVMTRVPGELLIDIWKELLFNERIAVASDLGRLIKQMHRLDVTTYKNLDQSFDEWILDQKTRVHYHHEKTGLSPKLVDEVTQYVSTFHSTGEAVLLTGEYTPFNLLVNQVDGQWTLTGLIDFADCFIGESTYDLLGPILFTFYKEEGLTKAFLEGYGLELSEKLRERLMQLLLLHRFSHLPNYMEDEIVMSNVESLEELARQFFSIE